MLTVVLTAQPYGNATINHDGEHQLEQGLFEQIWREFQITSMRHMHMRTLYTQISVWLEIIVCFKVYVLMIICMYRTKIFIILPLYTGQIAVVTSKYQVKKPATGDLVDVWWI